MVVLNSPSSKIYVTVWAVIDLEFLWLSRAFLIGCKIPRPVILTFSEVIWRNPSCTCFTPNITGWNELAR